MLIGVCAGVLVPLVGGKTIGYAASMLSIRVKFHQTCHAVVAYMAPCGKDKRICRYLKVLDYVDLIASAVDVAIPEAVVVFALTGSDKRKSFVSVAIGILQSEILVDFMGRTVVESLIGTITEIPAKIRVDDPHIAAGTTFSISKDCRRHIVGHETKRDSKLRSHIGKVYASAVGRILFKVSDSGVIGNLRGKILPTEFKPYAVDLNPNYRIEVRIKSRDA